MKTLIVTGLLAALALPTAASAVTMGDIRQDRQDLREERSELQEALRSGSQRQIAAERRDVANAREEYRDGRIAYTRQTGDHRYNLGLFNMPRGVTFRAAQVGHRINRAFLTSDYLIAQPTRYGLSRPRTASMRWVHYRNDAVLVDTRTAAVIAIRNNLFW